MHVRESLKKKIIKLDFIKKKIIFPEITFNNTRVNEAKVNHLQKEWKITEEKSINLLARPTLKRPDSLVNNFNVWGEVGFATKHLFTLVALKFLKKSLILWKQQKNRFYLIISLFDKNSLLSFNAISLTHGLIVLHQISTFWKNKFERIYHFS